MLMSAESTLDERWLFVRHLPKAPITYVIQRVRAGHAAASLTRMLQTTESSMTETPLTLAEVNNLKAISALTFGEKFDQSLEGVTLPVNLQTLTFGELFDQSLEGVTLPADLQTLTFGYNFNQKSARCHVAS